MHFRELAAGDATCIAMLWHTCAAESGDLDVGFRPRAAAAAYAELLRPQLESSALFGWGAFAAASADAALLGYLTAEVRDPRRDWEQDCILYILDVDVEPAARRKGIARQLVNLALAKAATLNVKRVELGWSIDASSSAVWARLGFRQSLTRGFIEVAPATPESPPPKGRGRNVKGILDRSRRHR